MRVVPPLLEILGSVAIAYGVALWSVPAAWIWGGVACFGLSWSLEARAQRRARAHTASAALQRAA